MVEIKVTYETLFDLLRREKGRNELQELEQSFYLDVKSYLDEKTNSLTISSSRGEKEKIRIQLKNIKKILKELYELREKKIINLASSKVRTNSNLIDTSKLLEKEKNLFEDACDLFSKYKEEILEKVIEDASEYSEARLDEKSQSREKPKEESNEEKKAEQSVEPDKKSNETTAKQNDDSDDSSVEIKKIKILHNLPRFLGTDKKIYGPFKKGDVTQMPLSTAKLLLDKNRAEAL